jgi:hypothetical protein
MRCKPSRQDAKEFYSRHEDEYLERKEEEFKEFALDELEAFIEQYLENLDEEKVPTLTEFFEYVTEFEIPDDFTFKEKGEWLGDEYESFLGDCADQAYEEMRDSRLN